MFETARKYSERTYYNKTDLEKEMDYYLVDPLWHEIEQYRSLFRQEFPLQGKKTYLIRNPLVNDTMAITQEWLLAWLMKHQESSDVDIDLFWLKEAERERFTRLLVKMRYDKEMNRFSQYRRWNTAAPAVRSPTADTLRARRRSPPM